MLKKEHLRYSLKEGKVDAHLLSEKGTWPKRLQSHLELLQLSLPMPLKELRELGEALIAKHPRSRRLLQGLLAILERGTEIEDLDEEVFIKHRQETFDKFVRTLRNQTHQPELPPQPEILRIYGDLESERKVLAFSISTGLEWVRRYNLELVQGLIRQGNRIKINWPDLSTQRWKFLCRHLKFWGLLFNASSLKEGGVSLVIEGPLSNLGGHQTYRDRIAALVGILPQLEPFTLTASLSLNDRRCYFEIDEKANLKSFRRSFFDHQPEAWASLKDELNKSLGDHWQWREENLPQGDWEGWTVPDAVLIGPDQKKIDLHHFQKHQKEALKRVWLKLSEKENQTIRVWLLEKPLELEPQEGSRDIIFPYRSLISGKRLGSLLKKI